MPFGSVGSGQFGTYFIGYASSPDVIEQMLANMFLGKPPASHDRILDFSTAITGGLFFVPSADFLDDPPGAPSSPQTTSEPSDRSTHNDESLRIGGLNSAAGTNP